MINTAEPLMVRYLHEKGAKEGIPVSGTFELTDRCNFSCEMCYIHKNQRKEDPLTASDWITLGGQAKNAGTVFLLLTGGEPLLREDFSEIYTALIKMGFVISINTNGSLLGNYIELFKMFPPSRINVSLYGGSDDAYKRLCKRDCFDTVISNIKKAQEAGLSVRLNSILTPENCDDGKKIVDIANSMKLHLKPTAYSYPALRADGTRAETAGRFTPEKAGELIYNIDKYRFNEEYYNKRAEKILRTCPTDIGNKIRCRAGRSSYWITYEGKMLPCGMMDEPAEFPLRTDILTAFGRIREKTDAIRLPEECRSCEFSDICSVCAAMCKAETGEFNKKPEYVCRMTKTIYSLTKKEKSNGD